MRTHILWEAPFKALALHQRSRDFSKKEAAGFRRKPAAKSGRRYQVPFANHFVQNGDHSSVRIEIYSKKVKLSRHVRACRTPTSMMPLRPPYCSHASQ